MSRQLYLDEMLNGNYLAAIETIAERLSGRNICWTLAGSGGQSLQGLNVVPKDIDLLSNKDGVFLIEDLLSDFAVHSVRYSTLNNLRSYYGQLYIAGTSIELMAEVENLINDVWVAHGNWENSVRHILLNGYDIPVLSLEYEYEVYKKLGLYLRANAIKAYLENTFAFDNSRQR